MSYDPNAQSPNGHYYGYDPLQGQGSRPPSSTGIQPGGAPGVLYNPGQIDLGYQNPEMYGELQRARGLRDSMDPFIQSYLDPNRYAQRQQDMQQRQATSTMNHYASMGLGGSSLAQNALQEGSRQIDFSFQDRAMGDHLKALQLNNMLTQPITQGIAGIQSQFSGYQDDYINAILGKQANDDANTRAIWGAGGSIVGGIAGFAAGGPAGAVAGANAGSHLGQEMDGFNGVNQSAVLSGIPETNPYAYSPPWGTPTTMGQGGAMGPDTGYNQNFY